MKDREIIIGKISIEDRDLGDLHSKLEDIHSIIDKYGGEEGWRLPTLKESRYIRSLYDLGIGNFTENLPFIYLMEETETGDGNSINSYHIRTKYLSNSNVFRVRLVKNL